jgi:TetR/AcrR family transcriptional repressor of nem operon
MSEIINKSSRPAVVPRSVRKRAEIIDVGSRLTFEQGYHGTSIKDIVDAIGMQKGSFYNYFPSKEEFIIEALEYHFESYFLLLTTELKTGPGSPVKRIVKLFRNYPGKVSSNVFSPLSFKIKVCSELSISHPHIDELVSRSIVVIRDGIADCLAEARDRGEISDDLDVRIVADFILYSWKGYILHADTARNKNTMDEFCTVLEQRLLV